MTIPSPHASFEDQMLATLPALRRYARSLSPSDGDGEDLLQDCCVRAITSRDQWRGLNLRGWLFTIMTNLYRNRYRGLSATGHVVALEYADDIPALPGADDPLARQHLIAALGSLSAEARTVLMLVVVEGYTYRQVAEIEKVPIGTVMSRLSRARRQLAAVLSGSNVLPHRRPE